MRAALLLRCRLVPFVCSLAHATRATGHPVVRPLLFDFPGEDRLARVQDQWTMGGRLMAAPVLEQGAANRTVLLPCGATWFKFNSTTTCPGPAVTVAAEMTTIPVFVRGGTVLPLAAPGVSLGSAGAARQAARRAGAFPLVGLPVPPRTAQQATRPRPPLSTHTLRGTLAGAVHPRPRQAPARGPHLPGGGRRLRAGGGRRRDLRVRQLSPATVGAAPHKPRCM